MGVQSIDIKEVLSRLQCPKKTGRGWTALCPSHEDKNNSLSVREGNDNRILFKCFAGCEFEDIIAALKIEPSDCFSSSYKPQSKKLTLAVFAQEKGLPNEFLRQYIKELPIGGLEITYRQMDGQLAPRQRRRTALKAKEGSYWTKGKEPLVPYGIWKAAATDLHIFEGETDTLTAWLYNMPAIGIPGANLTHSLKAEHLANVTTLYLYEEPDKGGTTFVRGMAQVLKDIGFTGNALVVQMPSNGIKDLNDLHKHCRQQQLDFKVELQKLIQQAKPLSQAGQPLPNKTNPIPNQIIGKSGKKLLQQKFAPIQWLLKGLIVAASVNVLAAKPKNGKSCLSLAIALAISTGGQVLGICVTKRDVLYLALEDSPRRLQDRSTRLLMGESIGEGFYYETEFPRLDLGGEEMLEQWSIEHPHSFIVVDVLEKIKPPEKRDSTGYAHAYDVISIFKRLANQYGVTFLLVHHNRKQDAIDTFDSVSGSNGLTAAVDSTLVIKKDRGKADAILAVTGRDIEEAEYKLEFKFPYWNMLGEATIYRKSSIRSRLVDILKEADKPLSIDEVCKIYCIEYAEDIEHRGNSSKLKNSIKQMLYQMTKDKEIVSSDRGKYTTNLTNITNKSNFPNFPNFEVKDSSKTKDEVSGRDKANHTLMAIDNHLTPDNSSIYSNNIIESKVSDNDSDVRDNDEKISKVISPNFEPNFDKPLDNKYVTDKVSKVRKYVSEIDSQPIITADPENQLTRRALAVAEFLDQNPTLIPRLTVAMGEMVSDPPEYSQWLHRQISSGQGTPKLISELETFERAISQVSNNSQANNLTNHVGGTNV